MMHLWSFNLNLFTEAKARSIITSAEYNRAMRFKRRIDQETSMFSRAGLRLALSEFYSSDPRSFILSTQENRPPILLHSEKIFLSLSHSGDQVLIGLSDKPIGVDIETIFSFPELSDLEQQVFHPSEKTKSLMMDDSDVRLAYFFWCWTAKEAYLKGLGVGLFRELSEILVPHEGAAVYDSMETVPWYVHRVDIKHGYMASVASQYKHACFIMHHLSSRNFHGSHYADL